MVKVIKTKIDDRIIVGVDWADGYVSNPCSEVVLPTVTESPLVASGTIIITRGSTVLGEISSSGAWTMGPAVESYHTISGAAYLTHATLYGHRWSIGEEAIEFALLFVRDPI